MKICVDVRFRVSGGGVAGSERRMVGRLRGVGKCCKSLFRDSSYKSPLHFGRV